MPLTATSVHTAQTGFIGPISGPMLPQSVTAVVVMVTVLASTAAAVLGVRPAATTTTTPSLGRSAVMSDPTPAEPVASSSSERSSVMTPVDPGAALVDRRRVARARS